MRKIIIFVIIVLLAVAVYSIQAIVRSDKYDYSFSYTGTAYQGESMLFDYYASGYSSSPQGIIINHKILFYSLSNPTLSLNIQTSNTLNDMILNIKNSTVLHSTGNNRIGLFNTYVLQQHINEDILLSNMTGINYTIKTTEDLFSKSMIIQLDFLNQYNDKNNINITSKMKCGLGLYLFDDYSCNTVSIIDFDLPIDGKFDTISLSGKINISKK